MFFKFMSEITVVSKIFSSENDLLQTLRAHIFDPGIWSIFKSGYKKCLFTLTEVLPTKNYLVIIYEKYDSIVRSEMKSYFKKYYYNSFEILFY